MHGSISILLDQVTVVASPPSEEAGSSVIYLAAIIFGVVLGSVLVIAITAGVVTVFVLRYRRAEKFKPQPKRY